MTRPDRRLRQRPLVLTTTFHSTVTAVTTTYRDIVKTMTENITYNHREESVQVCVSTDWWWGGNTWGFKNNTKGTKTRPTKLELVKEATESSDRPTTWVGSPSQGGTTGAPSASPLRAIFADTLPPPFRLLHRRRTQYKHNKGRSSQRLPNNIDLS